MTRIIYKIKDGYGEIRSICGTGSPLVIVTDSAACGYVKIGDYVSAIESGEAEFDVSRIHDGVYTPTISGDVHATLEPIKKEHTSVIAMPTPDTTLRHMLVRLERAEETVANLSARVDKLSVLYGKQVIF